MKSVLILTCEIVGGYAASEFLNADITNSSTKHRSSSVRQESVENREYKRVAAAMGRLYPSNMQCPDGSVRHWVSGSAVQHLNQHLLNGYFNVINEVVKIFGNHYDTLESSEKIAFCVARGVDAFFKGDMINASAFLLEARQINLVRLKGLDFGPLAAALYDIRFAIDARLGEALTEEQTNERLFFRLHLSKLLDQTHAENTSKDPEVFFALATMDRQDRVEVKKRNRKLYSHSVYLMAQCTANKILNNQRVDILSDVSSLVHRNLNFFQGENLYREEGQRLYLCVIGTVITNLFDRAFASLKEFADQRHAGTMPKCAIKAEALDRIMKHLFSTQGSLSKDCLETLWQISRNLKPSVWVSGRFKTLKELWDRELFLDALRSVGTGIFDDEPDANEEM